MAVPTVTTSAHALSNGWNFNGHDGNWWAEKRVQDGGKILCCGSTSASLLDSIQQSEQHHGRLKESPMFDKNAGTWKGHI